MGLRHCFFGVLNFVAFLLSVVILVGGIGLSVIAIGAGLGATATACYRAPRLFWFALLVMLLLILALFGIAVFGLVLAGDDYSQWRRLAGDRNWAKTLSCVRGSPECLILQEDDPQSPDEFNDLTISRIQSGCGLPTHRMWIRLSESLSGLTQPTPLQTTVTAMRGKMILPSFVMTVSLARLKLL